MQAIFTLKSVISKFVDNGSSCMLHHWTLIKLLIEWITAICLILYRQLVCPLLSWKFYFVAIANCNYMVEYLIDGTVCGMRWCKGSTLSPALFNLFINAFIVRLTSSGIGCNICDQYFGCLLHAEDIILLSPAVAGLQDMLNMCH